MTPALLTLSLGTISGCVVPGAFCDVVGGPLEFAPETASQIVATDRPSAQAIAAQNAYGRANCW